MEVTKKGEWLTNHPKSIQGYWPRRAILIREGQTPQQRLAYAAQVLEGMTIPSDGGLVGIWLDQDLVAPPIFYPLCKDQKTYEAELKRLEDPEELKLIQIAWELYQAADCYAAAWAILGKIEKLMGRDLDLQDTAEALAVGHPLEGEYPDNVEAYLESAKELIDESAPY
jgi:hypothetical protein